MTHTHLLDSERGHFTQQVERAALDLRCGLPIIVRDAGKMHLMASIDGITEALFDEMREGASGPLRLVLNEHRLIHLGLTRPPGAAAIALQPGDSLAEARRWATEPGSEWSADYPIFVATEPERAALALMRRGLLIPAALSMTPTAGFARTLESRLTDNELLSVAAADVFSHCRAAPLLRRLSEADTPLEADTGSHFVVFRESHVARQHVAVLIGERSLWPTPVPVRAHSACLTGDLFGSLRCDCGSQLRKSVSLIRTRGGGVLLYLAQEGRNTGLANKMRAYRIQDGGLDTVDADQALGFGGDERNYAVAREMLVQLGVTRIDLLTNNPDKLEGMDHEPIRVVRRSSIYGRLTEENRRYLVAKAERAGHFLDELLAEPRGEDEKTRAGRL